MKRLRLRFWLLVLDSLIACGWSGSRAWDRALRGASDATEWGEGADLGEGPPW